MSTTIAPASGVPAPATVGTYAADTLAATAALGAEALQRQKDLDRLEVLSEILDTLEPEVNAGRVTRYLTTKDVEAILVAAGYFEMRREALELRMAVRASWAYQGVIDEDGRCRILGPDGSPIPNRIDLAGHSPSGFAWGYGGSGPAQAALSLLAHFLDDNARALRLYQDVKFAFFARIPEQEGWTLTGAELVSLIAACEARQAVGTGRY